jgi:hypothetical protein
MKKYYKPSLSRIFQTVDVCFTTLHALVWSVHAELVQVQDCTTSFFHSAWFGKDNFAATLGRAKVRLLLAASKPSA